MDLSMFEPYKALDSSVIDFNKIRSIKDLYPEDYREKLEKNF